MLLQVLHLIGICAISGIALGFQVEFYNGSIIACKTLNRTFPELINQWAISGIITSTAGECIYVYLRDNAKCQVN